jgi:hypothetical protein
MEQETTLAEVQAEVNRQKAIMEDAQRRLCIASDALFKTKAIFAGIRRLPVELLGEIFIIHVRGNFQSPWSVMHVCRAWRIAALTTRAVWGAILLAPPSPGKRAKSRARILNGREVCVKELQLRRALARAGATPLDLRIGFELKRRRYYGAAYLGLKQKNAIESLLQHMPTGADKRKLRTLEIDTGGSVTFALESFDRFDFKDLEALQVDRSYPELIQRAAKEAKGLRRLGAPSTDIQKLVATPWLHRLEELEVLDNHYNDPTKIIRTILLSTNLLRSLSIHGGTITNEEPKIDLPHLRRLELRKVSCFWPIQCPNLTHLTIVCNWSGYEQLAKNSIHLPYLQVFKCTCFSSLPCLRAFLVPSLREFELEGYHSKSIMRTGMQQVWDGGSSPNINPILFRLRNAAVHPKVVADVVKQMTRLEELNLEHVSIGSEFLKELHPQSVPLTKRERQAGKKSPLWIVGAQQMKVMTIDLRGFKSKKVDAEAFEDAARELLLKREEANAPMGRIEVRLTEEDGWMVFCEEA